MGLSLQIPIFRISFSLNTEIPRSFRHNNLRFLRLVTTVRRTGRRARGHSELLFTMEGSGALPEFNQRRLLGSFPSAASSPALLERSTSGALRIIGLRSLGAATLCRGYPVQMSFSEFRSLLTNGVSQVLQQSRPQNPPIPHLPYIALRDAEWALWPAVRVGWGGGFDTAHGNLFLCSFYASFVRNRRR